MSYVCKTLEKGICQEWIENVSMIDTLAITQSQAIEISIAMILCFITGFIIGEIGHMIKSNFENKRY